MVVPTIGTVMRCFFADSTALRMASGTSPALPSPAPTRPFWSPTTTSALNEKRRAPLTTFATRFRWTTFSVNSDWPLPYLELMCFSLFSLDLPSGATAGFGQRIASTVVGEAAAIEDDRLDA